MYIYVNLSVSSHKHTPYELVYVVREFLPKLDTQQPKIKPISSNNRRSHVIHNFSFSNWHQLKVKSFDRLALAHGNLLN